MKNCVFIASLIVSVIIISCNKDNNVTPQLSEFGTLPDVARSPADNPITADKVQLGRMLFWDPILSGNKDVACVSCHHPNNNYAENIDLSVGVGGTGYLLTDKRVLW
jgi:cytochrome c peroxidase